jgi:hypothetical protein
MPQWNKHPAVCVRVAQEQPWHQRTATEPPVDPRGSWAPQARFEK